MPDTASLVGGFGGLFTFLGLVYTAVNHKHVRGKCCGRVIEMEIDIDSTTASAPKTKVHPAPKELTPETSL